MSISGKSKLISLLQKVSSQGQVPAETTAFSLMWPVKPLVESDGTILLLSVSLERII